jgi:hypothetical protein
MAKAQRYVSTFRAPTEYERQLEEARRRQALAEALAQQEYQPMEGTAAPIPKAAPLVKALQGYLTGREGRKAREAAEEAKGMEADYAQRMLGRMEGGYTYDPAAATPMPTPEQTELGEVTRQSQYVRAPEQALAMASTGLGAAALKDRPVMAERLAMMLKEPEKAKSPYGSIDPSKFTQSSLQKFDASVQTGKPDYTLLQSREYAELTPQQQYDIMFRGGEFGLNAARFGYETGLPSPPIPRFPFQSGQGQSAAPPQMGPPAAAPQMGPPQPQMPPAQPPMPPTGQVGPQIAPTAMAQPPAEQKRPPLIQTLPPKDANVLKAEEPKARRAAMDGLARLTLIDNQLAELENNPGTDKIFGFVGQIPVDIAPSARSAAQAYNLLRELTSVQALQQARESSTTGGAYGTMTEKEWPRFEKIFGAVDRSLDPKDARIVIKNARREIQRSMQNYENYWSSMYGNSIGYEPVEYDFQYKRFQKNQGTPGITVERLPRR